MNTVLKIKRVYLKNVTLGVCEILENGVVIHEGGTLELPWKENQQNISCIPEGQYKAFKRVSPKNGNVYELVNVRGRSYIQGHIGNSIADTLGCILHGATIHPNSNRVSSSAVEHAQLMSLLPNEFTVVIEGV